MSEKMTYPGKLAAEKSASGLTKRASPYARRLAALIRSGKIKAVNRRMLEGLFDKPVGPIKPLDYRAILQRARKTGRAPMQLLREEAADRLERASRGWSSRQYLDKIFEGRSLLKADDSILHLIEGGADPKAVGALYRELVAPASKNLKRTVSDLVGKGVISRETVRAQQLRGPGNILRGDEAGIRAAWDITQPGWATANPDIAMSYAHPSTQGVLAVANLKNSKAYKTGKTFFQGEFATSKRRTRVDLRNKLEAQYGKYTPENAYEIVLPGHEMRGMPWEYYVPVEGRHGAVLHKITDVGRFKDAQDELWRNKRALDDAVGKFLHRTSRMRDTPIMRLRSDLNFFRTYMPETRPAQAVRIAPPVPDTPRNVVTEVVQTVPLGDPPRTGTLAKLRSVLSRLGVKGWTAAGLTSGAVGTGAGLGYHYRQNRTS